MILIRTVVYFSSIAIALFMGILLGNRSAERRYNADVHLASACLYLAVKIKEAYSEMSSLEAMNMARDVMDWAQTRNT